jgi:hypothetical protein
MLYKCCCLLLAASFLSVLGSLAYEVTTLAPPTMVSVCGDPGMKLPPKILLEGWNFCNRAGRSCNVAPRWADCIGPDGVERVTPADNAAGLPLNQQGQAECDSFTEEKERTLGHLCEDTDGNSTSYFWTAMFKSGAMNISERGSLCGLWCANKTPDCNAAAVNHDGVTTTTNPFTEVTSWKDTNYVMRQPRVLQEWTVSDGSGGWRGSFYGTLDEYANLTALPTPSQLIDEALGPNHPGSSLAGTWLGQGDERLVISVTQESQDINFNASCTWAPGTAGLPLPWVNQTGTINAQNRIAFHVSGHLDTGFALGGGEGQSADLVCWSPISWWCRNAACDGGNASSLCAQMPNISSYFGMEWVTRGGRSIHRHVLRAGNDLSWLMLYTGPEAATGLKGGYEWDGRGQYSIIPQSTTRNASNWNPSWGKMPSNNFQVIVWTNITLWQGGPGFYFLNMGACWKDAGIECDGDITTDVTRYLLFQIPSPPGIKFNGENKTAMRCGPDSEEERALCPPSHRYRNGTIVEITDTARFPFRAYHSVSTRVRDADGGFRCKHDCWSNPCDQDWVRLEPAPEWAEYGFPDTVAAAMSPNKWTMNVGAVTSLTSSLFSGITPPILEWTTLNMGPEMMGSPGVTAIWEVAESDVLIEEGSQGKRHAI